MHIILYTHDVTVINDNPLSCPSDSIVIARFYGNNIIIILLMISKLTAARSGTCFASSADTGSWTTTEYYNSNVMKSCTTHFMHDIIM